MVDFMRPVPICESCRWFEPRLEGQDFTPACKAYRDGIPDAIYEGGYDHRRAYFGDGGIRWRIDPIHAFAFLAYGADVDDGVFRRAGWSGAIIHGGESGGIA